MENLIIKALISIFTAIMTLLAPLNTVKAPVDTSDFVPVIRFSVASDTHIKEAADTRTQRMQKAISLAYSDAKQDPNYKNLDAVLWAGDLTDQGYRLQFRSFFSSLRSVVKKNTQVLAVVAKSHDGYTMDKGSLDYFTKLSGQPSDYHVVINGFHFIGISASKTPGEHYSEYQRTWLSEELAKAAADDAEKPIFVMHHEHVRNTVYGSTDLDGWGMDYFTDILEQYPQIVDFSGHSHYPINDPRSIWQGSITAVGTGSLYYAEFTVDTERKVHPEGYKEFGQSWIVEVDKDNTVRLRAFDVLSGELYCEYLLHNVADASAREYTPAQQEAASSAPVFAKDAALTVKNTILGHEVIVPVAESTDGFPVFVYRFFVYNENGEEVSSSWVLNKYWNTLPVTSIKKIVSAKSGYTIKVTAENAYGMRTAPLEIVVG